MKLKPVFLLYPGKVSTSSHITVQSFLFFFIMTKLFLRKQKVSVLATHPSLPWEGGKNEHKGHRLSLNRCPNPWGPAGLSGEVIVCVKEERFRWCFSVPNRVLLTVCCCTLGVSEQTISPICSYNNLLFNPYMGCKLPHLRHSLDSMSTLGFALQASDKFSKTKL